MSGGTRTPADAYAGRVDDPRTDMITVLAEVTANLVDEYDAGAVLSLITDGCSDVLGADAGIILRDAGGELRVAAASNESARFAELLQSQTDEGPCVDTIVSGRIVRVPDLREVANRWPLFAAATRRVGYESVYSVPLRIEAETVGGLNVFYHASTDLNEAQIRLGRILADLAALTLTQPGMRHRQENLAERTLTALNDRVELDHAVGLLAGATDLDPTSAATAILAYARRVELRPADVARALVTGALSAEELAATTGTSG